ncbi:MAG: hypothetical protein Q9160_008849 [Pyrenula sp. 1 TL-2023]
MVRVMIFWSNFVGLTLDVDNRMHGGMNNRHSIGDFDQGRSHGGSNLQNYYASQRYQGRTENDQMAHAKRRMAAQRERELRNYHQEQQYNRSVLSEMSSSKSDRSMSPSAVSEEGRRELIARQQRALYGNEAPPFFQPGGFEDSTSRPETQGSAGPPSAGPGMRGSSPRARDPFGVNPNTGKTTTVDSNNVPSLPQEGSKANDPSPASGTAPSAFGAFDQAPPQSNKPASPNGGESPSRQAQKSATAPIGSAMGPIGSRPQQAGVQSLNKRSTTPLTYGKGSNDNTTERSASAASNPSGAAKEPNNVWGNGSGVWGTKSSLGATSVWG